jgi:hypothetical protein
MEIYIAPHYNEFIHKEMASSKFNNEAEGIQAGLVLLEKDKPKSPC